MRNSEDIFEQWLDNKDTTKNVIEHLRGQKSFHLDFAEFLLAELKHKELQEEYGYLMGMVHEWYLKYGKDEKFAAFFGLTSKRQGSTTSHNIEILDVSNLDTSKLRGGRPPKWAEIVDSEYMKNVTDIEAMMKLWDDAKPKANIPSFGVPLIFGTAGELSVCPECQEIKCECDKF